MQKQCKDQCARLYQKEQNTCHNSERCLVFRDSYLIRLTKSGVGAWALTPLADRLILFLKIDKRCNHVKDQSDSKQYCKDDVTPHLIEGVKTGDPQAQRIQLLIDA